MRANSGGGEHWFTYLATVDLLHFVQELVETGLHVLTLDLHHVQGRGGGGGEPAIIGKCAGVNDRDLNISVLYLSSGFLVTGI